MYVMISSAIGGWCALLGLLFSGLTNLPSGPSVVMVQFLGFLLAMILSSHDRQKMHLFDDFDSFCF